MKTEFCHDPVVKRRWGPVRPQGDELLGDKLTCKILPYRMESICGQDSRILIRRNNNRQIIYGSSSKLSSDRTGR